MSDNPSLTPEQREALLKMGKKLDKLLDDFVREVYAISGMKRPNAQQAALFASSEAGELLEEHFGQVSPVAAFARFAGLMSDLAVSQAGGWKRSHPERLASKKERAGHYGEMMRSFLGIVLERHGGKTTVADHVSLYSENDGGVSGNIALEAGQTAFMAWQSSVFGEEDGEKIPGPFEAVAKWAIKLGERNDD